MFDLSSLVGQFGPWQRNVFIFTFVVSAFSAWNNLIMAIFAPPIKFSCVPPEGARNISVLQPQGAGVPSECFYLAADNETVRPCTRWKYDNSFYKSTLVDQWDLVCDRQWLISLSNSVYMAGYMTSMLVFGQLSDRFGRRPIIFLSLGILLVASVGCLLVTDFLFFVTLRFFLSLGVSGAGTTGFILLMELVGKEKRVLMGVGFNMGWATGYAILPGLAWLLRHWYHLQAAITTLMMTLLISWWYVPESPRWLLSHHRVQEAEDTIISGAVKNGRESDTTRAMFASTKETLVKEIEEEGKLKNVTFFDLMKSKILRRITLMLYFCWFSNSFIYFGLSFNTNELAGDPLLNFFLAGVLEFPAYLATVWVLPRLGRRWSQMGALGLGGLTCVLTLPAENIEWLHTTLALSGKFCITASFAMLYVFSAELFPTVVRNIGLGSSSAVARAGAILAPFTKELGQATYAVVPFTVYGALALASVILMALLPETMNCQLPDSIRDGEVRREDSPPPKEGENTES